MVMISTNLGDFTLELFPDKAPVSVENFLKYVDEGFYDGTVFHRVIPNFMIQGGGFTPEMQRKQTHAPIRSEADNGILNTRYSVAMARIADIHSATSQFFINLKDNEFLDHGIRDFGYAVFGKVKQGCGVIDMIASVKTGKHGQHANVPCDPVIIQTVRRLAQDGAS